VVAQEGFCLYVNQRLEVRHILCQQGKGMDLLILVGLQRKLAGRDDNPGVPVSTLSRTLSW